MLIAISQARRQALEEQGQAVPTPILIRALVDTGATCTCIDTATLAPLQISPTGQSTLQTASTGNAPVLANQFDVALVIPGPTQGSAPLVFETIPIVALDGLSTQGFQALIGRDILSKCVLHYNGDMGLFTLAY